MRPVLFALCLLFSVCAYAQKIPFDTLSVQVGADREIAMDSIAYYQKLANDYRISASYKKEYGYTMLALGVAGLIGGGYFLNQMGAGGAGYVIIPVGLLAGGVGLSIGAWSFLTGADRRIELADKYEARIKELHRQIFERTSVESRDSLGGQVFDVYAVYREVEQNGTFKDLKKRANCLETRDTAGFYDCVGNLYDEAAKASYILGSVIAIGGAVATVYYAREYGRQSTKFSNGHALTLAVTWGAETLIGIGVAAYGAVYQSEAKKYRNMAGSAKKSGPLADLMVAPIVDPVNGNYGGALAFNF